MSNIEPTAVDLTGVSLTDEFSSTDLRLYTAVNPTFTDLSGNPNSSGCLGGVFSGNAGDSSITLSDASIAAGSICRFEFDITAFKGGNHINRIDAGDLITREGVTNPLGVAATLTVGRQVNVAKGFQPAVIAVGEQANVIIDLYNTNVIPNDETGASPALIDTLPAGLTIAGAPTTTCAGASITTGSSGGNDFIRMDGGTLVAEDVCRITVPVTASAPGQYTNQIAVGDLLTLSAATNPDPAEATLTVVTAPTVSKSFLSPTIAQGGTSRMRLTLQNSNNAALLPTGLTGVSLSDTFTNMELAAPLYVAGTCSGLTHDGTPGAGSITLSGISMPPGGGCYIDVDVTSSTPGLHDNQTSGVSSNQTVGAGAPSNVAQLRVLEPLTWTKLFEDDETAVDLPTRMTFTLTNPNPVAVTLSNPGFTDVFPTAPGQMSVAPTPDVVSTCSGAVIRNGGDTAAPAAGDTAILVRGGSVPASASCTISINVVAAAAGTYTNTTSVLNSTGGETPAASDTIEVVPGLDRGDAPVSGTTYGEVTHVLGSGLRLGALVDPELASIANADATGDGADDDGVTFPTLTQGQAATISVDVTQASANDGYLQGWIDWNGDGDFDDAGEQIASDLQSASAGTSTISVPVTVPANATTSQTFARFRWSTTSGLDSTAAASDGEVEDYALTIALGQPAFACSADFGQVYGDFGTVGVMDLVNQSFNDLDDVGFRLNAAGFRPSDGYIYAMGGETLYRIGSDGSATDLGVIAGLPAGQSANQGDFGPDGHLHIRYGDNGTIYRVNVETATLDGSYTISPYFNDTADFAYVADRDLFIGVRGFGATPRIFAFRPNTGASQSLGFIDPGFSGVSFGAAFADASGGFFAVNNSDGTLYEFDPVTGDAIALGRGAPADRNDGFLCRDATVVRPVDRSDGPLSYGEATHAIQLGIQMGALLDGNETSVISADATGDDLDGIDDEDGVTIPTLIPGQSATIDVDVRQSSAGQGYLNAWIDWNGDGDFSDSGEQVASDVQFTASASGTISLSVMPPRANASGQTFARFRWSSRAGLASFGPAPDGEVEDYAVTIAGVPGLSLTPDQTGQLRACGVQDYTHVLLNTGGTGEIVTVSVASQSLLVSEIFLPTEVNGAGEAAGFVSLNALTVGSQVATLTNGSWALEPLVDNGAGAPAFDLAPGEQTRVRARVTAPCETASGQVDTLVLRAVSSDGDASAEAVDVTTVSSNTLEITKLGALDAGCAGGADGPFDDARVRAEPGDCVIWQLTLLNTGTDTVCDVEARDAAPAFTAIQGSPLIIQQPAPGTGSCTVTGDEFSCSLGNPQDIDSDGTDETHCLRAGETAIVEFSVRIE